MEYLRSFISIDLPENISSKLQKIQEEFKRTFPSFKWVSIKSIHLTLKFLGNVEQNQMGPIKKELQKITETQQAFQLGLKETGLFPHVKRPRVVWVGLGGDIEALSRLQKRIDSALIPLGFVPEKRDFTPHLTLARLHEGLKPSELEDFGKQWTAVEVEAGYDFKVNSINLMKSTLKPTGAVYDVLASFPLKSS